VSACTITAYFREALTMAVMGNFVRTVARRALITL
jgi:hypothetical protein